MRLRRHFDLEESHGIDLAPMLDFVINLLIFFIITAVFAREIALQVNRPQGEMTQSEQAGEGQRQQIHLGVAGFNRWCAGGSIPQSNLFHAIFNRQ